MTSFAPKNFLISTTDSIAGYSINEYLGIIYGSTYVKLGIGEAIWEAISSKITFKDPDEAKAKLLGDAVQTAKKSKANGLIGLRFETTITSNGVISVSLSATAVKVGAKGSTPFATTDSANDIYPEISDEDHATSDESEDFPAEFIFSEIDEMNTLDEIYEYITTLSSQYPTVITKQFIAEIDRTLPGLSKLGRKAAVESLKVKIGDYLTSLGLL